MVTVRDTVPLAASCSVIAKNISNTKIAAAIASSVVAERPRGTAIFDA